MQVDDLLENNSRFVLGHVATPLPKAETLSLAIVTCFDPRLDAMIRPSLGIEPGEAFVFRTSGALIPAAGTTLRSLVTGVILFGVTEILVLGHTSCAMASFRAAAFIEKYRKRGVPREAFGDEDMRTWAGATSSPREGAILSVANLRAAPFLPRDLKITGAVLNDTTGQIDVVARPGETLAPAETAEAESEAKPTPATQPKEGSKKRAGKTSQEAKPESNEDLLEAVETFLSTLKARHHWRHDVGRLREQLRKPGSPRSKFALVERFAAHLGADATDVRKAFQRLRDRATAQEKGGGMADLLRHLARKL